MPQPAQGKSPDAEAAAAFREGRNAAHAGRLSTSNPYDAKAALASERVLAKMWMRGHYAGNPMPMPEDASDSVEEPDSAE